MIHDPAPLRFFREISGIYYRGRIRYVRGVIADAELQILFESVIMYCSITAPYHCTSFKTVQDGDNSHRDD